MVSEPRRGEVWWGEAPDAKGRPYLVLTRDQTIPFLRAVLVAPVTHTVRDIPSEVSLGIDEGLEVECAATVDNTLAFPKSLLVRRIGSLGPSRSGDLGHAVRAAVDC